RSPLRLHGPYETTTGGRASRLCRRRASLQLDLRRAGVPETLQRARRLRLLDLYRESVDPTTLGALLSPVGVVRIPVTSISASHGWLTPTRLTVRPAVTNGIWWASANEV